MDKELEFKYRYIFRSYFFALKIIAIILNKTTQYISFISITLFITFFLIIKQALFIYEDIFINSLKGLYPEFITSSTKLSKSIEKKYVVTIKKEIFVHSEEIEFSYDGIDTLTKFMNVRTYDEQYKHKLFSTLKIKEKCKEDKNTIWMSSRLYDNMAQDAAFDKKSIYFIDEDEVYQKYNICKFELDNNEKWLLIPNSTAKKIAYMPFAKYVIYTDNKEIKEQLYKTKGVNNWKKYIDYDDLGIFLLAQQVSGTFLATFFIFLVTFMMIAFSSLIKEFEASIFLTKLFGLNKYRTVVLYTLFFFIYTLAILLFVYIEYSLVKYIIAFVSDFQMPFDSELFMNIFLLLLLIGFVVSVIMTKKYHRLPL